MTFTHYLINNIQGEDANKFFFNYFQMSVSSFDEFHRRLKDSFQRRTNKMRNCTEPVEMLAAAVI